MTTGVANDAAGPNVADSRTTDFETAGDSDIDDLVGTTGISFDVAVLEFDFTTESGDLFFNDVFASEEYNEFANDVFNDHSAFFVDGLNVPLLPGSSTAVAINTVNDDNPDVAALDFSVNPEFFNNNEGSDIVPTFDIEYDGFTDVFTVKALSLRAGDDHIKIVIADVFDALLDSTVFIEAGSFTDTLPGIPEPATMAIFGFGLAGMGWMQRRRAA